LTPWCRFVAGSYYIHFKLTDLINIIDGKKEKKPEFNEPKTMHDIVKEMTSLKHLKGRNSILIMLGITVLMAILGTYVFLSPIRYFFYSLSFLLIIYLTESILVRPRLLLYFRLIGKRSEDFTTAVLVLIDGILVLVFLTLGISLSTAELIKSNSSLQKSKITFTADIGMNNDNLRLISSSKEFFSFLMFLKIVHISFHTRKFVLLNRTLKRITLKTYVPLYSVKKL
jgi:hypothetical protein